MGHIPNYTIRYNSDPRLVTDNHRSDILFLLDVDERNFDNIDDAVHFLTECTNPITKIEDIVPEVKKLKKPENLDWIMPESHIRPKHVLMCDIEDIYTNQDENGVWK